MSVSGPYRQRLVSIKQARELSGLCRTRLTALLDQGAIDSVKLLDRRLVVVSSLERFLVEQRDRAAQDGRVRIPRKAA